jgi:hypothetical protein
MLSYIFLARVFITTFNGWLPFELKDIFNATPLAIYADGSAWPPLLGIGAERMIPLLYLAVSFIILTIIPKTADIIKSMIEGKPFAYGTAIGEAFGPVRSTAGYAAALGIGKVGERVQEKMEDTPYRDAVGAISKAIGEKLVGGRR